MKPDMSPVTIKIGSSIDIKPLESASLYWLFCKRKIFPAFIRKL
jgi:hypothetical protein